MGQMARLMKLSRSHLAVLVIVIFMVLPVVVDISLMDAGFISRIANFHQDEVASPRLEREFGITLGDTDKPGLVPVLFVAPESFLYAAGLRRGDVIYLRPACIGPFSPRYGRRNVLRWLNEHRGAELTLRFAPQPADPSEPSSWKAARVLVPMIAHRSSSDFAPQPTPVPALPSGRID